MGRTTYSGPIRSTYGFETGTEQTWNSITLISETGGSGTCAVQMSFHDAVGTAMSAAVAGTFYLSEVATGLEIDVADTSIAVLTNGAVTIVDTGVTSYYNFVTTAAGLLGVTITAAADDYYLCFIKPNGQLEIVGPCTCDA